MIKRELAFELNRRVPELRKRTCESIVTELFEVFKDTLKKKESIYVRGFGEFCVKKRKGQKIIDPVRKETHKYDDYYVVKFTAYPALKELIAEIDKSE